MSTDTTIPQIAPAAQAEPAQPVDVDTSAAVRAARRTVGMLLFLASEVMLFAGMFALYAAGRIRHPIGFAHGVSQNLRWLGSTNTMVLLTSSWCIALAVVQLRSGRRRRSLGLILATMLLGLVFLGLKGYEYHEHVMAGAGPVAVASRDPGYALFMGLYWLMTGTHALHVIAGLILLGWMAWSIHRQAESQGLLELGAFYWHLVDMVWVFIWPLFYLMGRPG